MVRIGSIGKGMKNIDSSSNTGWKERKGKKEVEVGM
jgi:hypothetical protein